ncbi:polyphenol oxidase family protein [Ruania zhangjianzhongii]|uniref:polyphenol oxidase family protein n=1 Tax=Ruania zhangjianzhongii TaxID=2603206 RepID=UPI0011CB2FB2|nr:polyphenol oxidase family protein [Ruania zhangjianzhongii]
MLTADLGPGTWATFTTRAGGLSEDPYASLNLGAGVGDDPAAVARNRGRLAQAADAPVAFIRQVHGSEVFHWDAQAVPPLGEEPVADVVVSTTPGTAVAVLVADCVPVLLAGPGGVAAVHAGRKGVLADVVPTAVAALAEAEVPVTHAAIGPAICGRCYEVPDQLRSQAADQLPELWSTTSWGTPALDLAAGVRAQLGDAGITQIDHHPVCTLEDERFFSYRRSGVCGRFAGVARLS